MRHREVFMGRVGQLQDIRELSNGNCVVNFSVAETQRVKKGDTWEDGTTIWTNVTIFGDEARNFHRSVKPGTHVIIIGSRQANEYTVKDTNEKRTSQSVLAEQVGIAITKFDYVDTLGNVNYKQEGTSVPSKQGQQNTQAAKTTQNNTAPATNDDPFAGGDAEDPFGADDDPFGLNG